MNRVMEPKASDYSAITDLMQILRLKRAAGSRGELELIKRFIIPTGANRDEYGNWYLRIGNAPVLWSCHTDSVHHNYTDDQPQTQGLVIDETGVIASKAECLGADNATGIWLMLRMIAAGKEGLYIFHREEEIGGKGSKYIASETPRLLEGIKFAIAFDRRGSKSVITHQGTRSCSDAFANSLIEQLGMGHKLDDGGTFTDTASYVDLIPECTNVSAGFHHEHTYNECLDSVYLQGLLKAVLAMDVSKLVEERKVTDPDEYPDWNYWAKGRHSYPSAFYEQDTSPWFDEGYAQDLITGDPDLVFRILKSWGMVEDMAAEIERRVY